MKNDQKENRKMKSMLKDHDIKLNTTVRYSMSSPWTLGSDTTVYPTLKSTNHLSHFSKLPNMLSMVKLEGDDITLLQHFHDTAFMTILSSDDFTPDYTNLYQYFECETCIVPPSTNL